MLTALTVLTAIPASNGINNFLKRRNLPTLLTVYLILNIIQIVLSTNLNFLHQVNKGKYTLTMINQTLSQYSDVSPLQLGKEISRSNGDMKIYSNQTGGQNIDGTKQIFLSILQSPSYLICDTSLLSSVLVTLAILLFSPYMLIFSLEGAAISYFTSLAPGLDTGSSTRYENSEIRHSLTLNKL